MARQGFASRTGPAQFSINPSDELPVGVQLGWRLRALISTGEWTSGERLPSCRRLAEWAGVNVNTVRAVYGGLEEEGLVVSRQGQGTFVADGVEPTPRLGEIATDALQRTREAGLSPRDLAIVALARASIRRAGGR
ncbi:MAG TPA: GntR family transcriptional regulator [Solirubrobacterales bacterium]